MTDASRNAELGTGTTVLQVLIVDDEPAVGRTLARLIADEHQVETASSAAEAIARIGGGQRYDVILCDLMMPEETGMDLYHRLLEVAPGLARHMLFMTGGVFTPAAEEFLAQPDIRVIEKPIRRDPLLTALARAAGD